MACFDMFRDKIHLPNDVKTNPTTILEPLTDGTGPEVAHNFANGCAGASRA